MDATLKSFLAAALYAFFSTSITFFNKAVLSSYAFRWPNLMTLVQMACSLVFLLALRAAGAITYPKPSWAMSHRVMPLSIAFMGMVLTGLGALKYLNIPMFNTLRRVTTVFTMLGEAYWLGKRESRMVQFSVYLMIFGALIAAFYDFDFNALGYFLVSLNCAFTAAYLLYIAQLGKSSGLGTFGLMFYNNAQSLPFVAALCWLNGDFAEVASYPHLWTWDFQACFLFQSALAFLLNYSIFLCTQINSALATSVTGQMKNIVTTLVGYFSFGDVTYNAFNVLGLALGVVSSSWYSWLKFQESERNKKKEVLPVSSPQPALGAGQQLPDTDADADADEDVPLVHTPASAMQAQSGFAAPRAHGPGALLAASSAHHHSSPAYAPHGTPPSLQAAPGQFIAAAAGQRS